MIRQLTRPLLRPLTRSLLGMGGSCERWVYDFDGVNDFAQFAEPVQLAGDYVIEFTVNSSDWSGTEGRRVFGTAGAPNNRAFFRYEVSTQGFKFHPDFSTGGERFLPITPADNQDYRFRIEKAGSVLTLSELTTGQTDSRETDSDNGVIEIVGGHLSNRFIGVIKDFRINGHLYPINDPTSNIQLAEPSGLGAELITQHVLENPSFADPAWVYLGEGRWSAENLSLGSLRFFPVSDNPNGFLEFEIESITGLLTCTVSAVAGSVFNSVGVKRFFYTEDVNANKIEFKRAAGTISCIIKNISFKPLGTANPLTLVNTNSERWSKIPC